MKFTSRMKVQRMIANPNHLRMGNREVAIRLQRERSSKISRRTSNQALVAL
jgi:hypothetical protein